MKQSLLGIKKIPFDSSQFFGLYGDGTNTLLTGGYSNLKINGVPYTYDASTDYGNVINGVDLNEVGIPATGYRDDPAYTTHIGTATSNDSGVKSNIHYVDIPAGRWVFTHIDSSTTSYFHKFSAYQIQVGGVWKTLQQAVVDEDIAPLVPMASRQFNTLFSLYTGGETATAKNYGNIWVDFRTYKQVTGIRYNCSHNVAAGSGFHAESIPATVVDLSFDQINVGDTLGGGVVIKLLGNNTYLIVATEDQSTSIDWGTVPLSISGSLSDGESATNSILATETKRPIAASVCRDYNGGGYTNWYLPSSGELAIAYPFRAQVGMGPNHYWSTTIGSDYLSYYRDFANNIEDTEYRTHLKYARAMRKHTV